MNNTTLKKKKQSKKAIQKEVSDEEAAKIIGEIEDAEAWCDKCNESMAGCSKGLESMLPTECQVCGSKLVIRYVKIVDE